ncbi:electron transfer flavoprotein, alpha subunit [Geobacter metallireducens GS-15]|uniref:Electron transfer flavoprotein, alpha subunit n=1 Tax=Geobacter metallireducens (strain ATCC 53774 / DSM 7210 / GS-15) TaxID=269799 RepID=Q39TD3_GEOMG|nr:electron transfer flavoprotein subunit alpha/FixB family protein [Geobacter metallireducens]ABB32491.1 electron transfer flavoprotein, alpha subunit [Geobacter metallireducens GS-15]
MAAQIFAYIKHKGGAVDDTALELISAARNIDASAEPIALVAGSGADLDQACSQTASTYKQVWKLGNSAFAYPNAEVLRKALLAVLPTDAIVLVPHDAFGMDLSPGLSIKLDATFVADVLALEVSGNDLRVVRQEYGGQVSSHSLCRMDKGAVINIRPGAFAPVEALASIGEVVDKSSYVAEVSTGREFVELIEAVAGDVDITKEDILVSIGRGIGDEEGIQIAEELAEAMGGVVSCSRPIVDAKWMDKSRQVGTSGQTVKPKVYLACGISGSFQHLGGIKGNPFVVAINKNPKAPIFQVADVGIVADLQEFLPELTERINEG